MDFVQRTSPTLVATIGLLTVVGLPALRARAQDSAPAFIKDLRAELRAARQACSPNGAIRLRFTLTNTSDQPVEVPLEYPISAADGSALPLQLALGSGDQRLVSVVFEGETAKEVPAPPPPPNLPDGARFLRLAPHGMVGVEIDLREYFPALRYCGAYRIEWRPLDGRLGTLTTELKVDARKDAILITDHPGKITFALNYDGAPLNVENFVDLVREGFYTGKMLHRIVPGWTIQGGCPKGDGTGVRPDGRLMPAEFSDTPIDVGTLCMARKKQDPNSASCQFFVALARLPELDGKYTVIGQVRDEESLQALQQLAETPTDRLGRPLSPLVIRSINLVSAEERRVHDLEPPRRVQSTALDRPIANPVAASRPARP